MPYDSKSIFPDFIVFPSAISAIAIGLWSVQAYKLGEARKDYKVKAPHVDGDPKFELIAHEYQNTSEALGAFIPATFMFSYYISPKYSAILGGTWLFSKMLSCCSFCTEREKETVYVRAFHICLTHLSFFGLLAGSAIGIGSSLHNRYKL
ncbi:hypothetical protein RB653_009293 [Dictyostelium firmibasis]|uniref:MAPEG family protein n=1 Tax=Dictyostelium firmibasis TaxID=79012 RepID=A0AAN7U1J2_9MYCE